MQLNEQISGYKDPFEPSVSGKNLIQTHLVPRTKEMNDLLSYLSTSPRGEKLASVVNLPPTIWMTRKDEFIMRLHQEGLIQAEQPVVLDPDDLPGNKWFEATFNPNAFYFIKPLGLSGEGRGVQRVLGRHLKEALKTYQEYVLVQAELDFDREFRWWFYQDAKGNLWRIVYEKAHPKVEGTGEENLFQLILKERKIPLIQRARLLASNSERLFEKPNSGEIIKLNNGVGSRSHGSYEKLLKPGETELLHQLDTQATELMQQLAIMSNVPGLVHAVFDLGWKEGEESIVPIEFQFPYSTRWWSYANHDPISALKVETAIVSMILSEHFDKPRLSARELAQW